MVVNNKFEQQMEIENFEKIRVLGQGTYGKCYLVLDRARNDYCVLKQIEIMGMTQQQIDESVREARILQSLSHGCVVKFLGWFQTKDGHLNIVMTYADGGDLNQKIKQVKMKHEVLPQSQILHWFTQLSLAIQHVHERKIIHRDIKSQNVFLTKQGNVKLGDFGIARPLQLTLQKIKSVVGTPYYMSPEICENKQYSFKTDIWSLGVILLEMCLLRPPFDANSLPALALKISKGEYSPVPKFYSKQLKKLVVDMMQVDPVKRPTMVQILSSPLLRDRAALMRFKQQNESSSVGEISVCSKKGSGPASRGLFIECNLEEQAIEQAVSPKNVIGHGKHHDMPVKRVDNYVKEVAKGSAMEKKAQKRGEQLRRRETSQPNLTPKGHSKIENERKVMVKNNSQLNFQKKKSGNSPACFKKKVKSSQDIAKNLEEIHQFKNDIYSMHGQISHRDREPSRPLDIAQLEEPESEEEEVDCPQETPLETLQQLLQEHAGQADLDQLYRSCEIAQGVSPYSDCAGLLTLVYGCRNFVQTT